MATESEKKSNLPLKDYVHSELGGLVVGSEIVQALDSENPFSVALSAKRDFEFRVKTSLVLENFDSRTGLLLKDLYWRTFEKIGSNNHIIQEEMSRSYVDYLIVADDYDAAREIVEKEVGYHTKENISGIAGYLAAKISGSKNLSNEGEFGWSTLLDDLLENHGHSLEYIGSYIESLMTIYVSSGNLDGLLDLRGQIGWSATELFGLTHGREEDTPDQMMVRGQFEFLRDTNEIHIMKVQFNACETDGEKRAFIHKIENPQVRYDYRLLFIEEMLTRGKRLRVSDLVDDVDMFLEDLFEVTEIGGDEGYKSLYGNVGYKGESIYPNNSEDELFNDDLDQNDRLIQMVRLAKALAPYDNGDKYDKDKYELDIWKWFVIGGEDGDDEMVIEDRTIVGLVEAEKKPLYKARGYVDLVRIAVLSDDYQIATEYSNQFEMCVQRMPISKFDADRLRDTISLEIMTGFPEIIGGYDSVEAKMQEIKSDETRRYACDLILKQVSDTGNLSKEELEISINWLFEVIYGESVGELSPVLLKAINNSLSEELEVSEQSDELDEFWFSIPELEYNDGDEYSQYDDNKMEIIEGTADERAKNNQETLKKKQKHLAAFFSGKLEFLSKLADVLLARGKEDLVRSLLDHSEITKELRANFLLDLSQKFKRKKYRR